MKNITGSCLVLAFVLPLVLYQSAWAAEKETAKLDPQADDILTKAADFYKTSKAFTTKADFNMTARTSGSEHKVWANYDVAVERPDKAALRLTGGLGLSVVSDGKLLFGYIPNLDKYTETSAPNTLEGFFHSENLTLVNNSLGNLFLLSQLMQANPREALLDGVSAVKYEGLDTLAQVKAQHLRFIRENFDLEVWFQDGLQPFLLKVVPDIAKTLAKNAEKMPLRQEPKVEMALTFSNWNTPIVLPAQTFAYSMPANAKWAASFFEKEKISGNLAGRPAPAANLDLLGGIKFDLAQLKGRKIVLLGFWASWSEPCVSALPIEAAVAKEYADRGAIFFAVNERETPEAIKKFLADKNPALNVVLDSDGKLSSAYGVKDIPFLAVVGKDGIVHYVHTGMASNLKAALKQEIEALLAEEAIPTSYEEAK